MWLPGCASWTREMFNPMCRYRVAPPIRERPEGAGRRPNKRVHTNDLQPRGGAGCASELLDGAWRREPEESVTFFKSEPAISKKIAIMPAIGGLLESRAKSASERRSMVLHTALSDHLARSRH